MDDVSGQSRARGKRAGLDLKAIVDAARALPPGKLTMSAVADRLGVDRKALHHYVPNRENLRALVAAETLSEDFASVEIEDGWDWEQACRAFADALVHNLIKTDSLIEHFRWGEFVGHGFITPGEKVLHKLVNAGFPAAAAGRLLLLLSNICISFARDTVLASRDDHMLVAKLRLDIDRAGTGRVETISRLLSEGLPVDHPDQFAISMDVFIGGAARLLAAPR